MSFWWYPVRHFDVWDKESNRQGCYNFFLLFRHDPPWIHPEKSRARNTRKSDIILSLRIQDKTVKEKQQHILQIHQSDQLQNRKFYENFSEYANFSKSSDKVHKTKGQII